MSRDDEEIIVVQDADADEADGPSDGLRADAGSVEVVVEGKPVDEPYDAEPMPVTQRVILIVVAVIIVLGIAGLIAYWNGFLG